MAPDRCREKSRPTPAARKVRMAKQATVSMTVRWTLRTPMPTETKPSSSPSSSVTEARARCSSSETPAPVSTWVLSPFKTDKD